ncbi:MAG: hypothetical protein ISS70_13535 [Phycisphaerae bacterium]|nr:hypothetical protein [Phycisphaerae bacterium]
MYKSTIIIIVLSLCFSQAKRARAGSDAAANEKAGAPTISVTKLDINEKTLELSYEIRNTSGQDIWILTAGGRTGSIAFVYMDEDDQTLLIQSRLDLPMTHTSVGNIYGRYVLLRRNQIRTESVTIAIPVYQEYLLGGGGLGRGNGHATRVAIEIGYCVGDLPGMIRRLLEQAEGMGGATGSRDEKLIKYYFKGPLHFNKENEILRQRDEEILIPHTDRNLQGEKVMRKIVEGLRIPYEEEFILEIIPDSIDIPPCKSVEIQYKPSMLDYLYRYKGQRSLLNDEERQSLQSVKAIVVEDQEAIKSFIGAINKGYSTWGIVREVCAAQVVCYDDDKRLASFRMFDDVTLVINERGRFIYPYGSPLRRLTPQIEPFELRMQCAANLRNLWHRLRLCQKAQKNRPVSAPGKTETLYPAADDWCDAMVRACRTIRMSNEDIILPCICPSVEEAKKHLANCHYAMNPNCKFDSPPDVVLLFEAKAGWNQRGGRELFMFDNHDPKGGCVLLNDGTVKFIRTAEELRRLRWK